MLGDEAVLAERPVPAIGIAPRPLGRTWASRDDIDYAFILCRLSDIGTELRWKG